MKTAIAKYNWITNNACRLDASYHLSDGRQTKFLIEKSPLGTTPLSNLTTNIFMGPRFKRYYVDNKETGVPFMGGSDMQKTNLTNLKLISKKMTKSIGQLYLKRNWTLVTRSGTVGQTVFTNTDFEEKTATEDVIRIIANENHVKSGFLHAFLTSKYGYNLLTQSTYGAVIQHIEPHHLINIPIPKFSDEKQEEVHNSIIEVSDLRVKASKLLKETHEIFNTKLAVKKINNRKILSIKVGALKSFQERFDAGYHLGKVASEEVITKSGVKTKTLGDLIKSPMFTAQRGRRVYVQNGVKFLSTTDISKLNTLRIKKFLSKKTKGLSTLMVEKDWILISSSGQEILGSAFMIDDTHANCAVNQHSIRVIIDEEIISPNYVYGFLSSKFGKRYIRSGIYGSAILTINEDFLAKIKIPILSDENIEIISNKVKDARAKLEKASFLEYNAIQTVENEIASWQKSNTQQEA